MALTLDELEQMARDTLRLAFRDRMIKAIELLDEERAARLRAELLA